MVAFETVLLYLATLKQGLIDLAGPPGVAVPRDTILELSFPVKIFSNISAFRRARKDKKILAIKFFWHKQLMLIHITF